MFMISIHAPREGGDAGDPVVYIMTGISIHAPREGGDWKPRKLIPFFNGFQSTPPARGATVNVIEIRR